MTTSKTHIYANPFYIGKGNSEGHGNWFNTGINLANVFREKGSVEIQAIGAGALNQAIKAIAIARGFVAPSGKNLVCIPAFTDIVIDGDERTAIKLIIEAR